MSTLVSIIGRWSFLHPWRVVLSWLLAAGIVGAGAFVLSSGTENSFSIPGTESQAGIEQLARSFPQVSGTSARILVIAPEGQQVSEPFIEAAIEDVVAELAELEGVLAVTSPADELVNGLISDDGRAAIIQVQFEGEAFSVTDESKDALREIVSSLNEKLPAGSLASLGGELFAISIPGVTITEALGVVIALIVLIVTFRSFRVAGLPLVTALLGVGIAMAGIFAATAFTTISATTPLLALMLGLAVGIDYSLFIIARHQDFLREGMDPEESAARAVGTAGSAVVFAGITVMIALIGLSLAGIPFLTTMGVAASVAVAVSVAIAITLTPALLGFLGIRAAGKAPKSKSAPESSDEADENEPAEEPEVPINRYVKAVTKRPIITSAAVIALLGVLAIPAASLTLALPNAGILPVGNDARTNYDLVSEHFGTGFNGPLVLTGTIITSTDPLTLMQDLADDVAKIPGVAAVPLATPNMTADTGIVQIIPETAPDAPETAELVRTLRAHHDRWLEQFGVDLLVTGFTAVAIDVSDQLGAALLPFGIFVIGLSLVLLTIVFRSIWVPITAAAGYLISTVAAFGVIAAVFEWGIFADLLHVARTGPVISFMPIVLMGVLFGLAMDYHVFLVSRMREAFVHDPESARPDRARAAAIRAVQSGFTSSARVVFAAALIMFAVFAAFVPEGDSTIKPIALGLAVGVAIDAFLVRMTLIPAIMTLLGDRAWRLPKWLERLLPSVDVEGEAVERERALAHWPGDNSVIAAEKLTLAGGVATRSGITLNVQPGDALLISGNDQIALRALALTLSGRMTPNGGRLRVAGFLLPERALNVRSRVGIVLGGTSRQTYRDLKLAVRAASPLVVIDRPEVISEAYVNRAAAVLRNASIKHGIAVVITTDDLDKAKTLLAKAGFADPIFFDFRPSASRTNASKKVNA